MTKREKTVFLLYGYDESGRKVEQVGKDQGRATVHGLSL